MLYQLLKVIEKQKWAWFFQFPTFSINKISQGRNPRVEKIPTCANLALVEEFSSKLQSMNEFMPFDSYPLVT